MKKIALVFLFGTMLVSYFACVKKQDINTNNYKDPFVVEALNFLDSTISQSEFTSLNLSTYSVTKDANGISCLIRFYLKEETSSKFIIVGKTESGFEGNWVDASKLNTANDTSLSGVLDTRSFDNNERAIVSFSDNRVVKIAKTKSGKTNTTTIRYENGKPVFISQNQAVARGEDGDDFLHNTLPEVVVYPTPQTPITYYSVYYMMNSNPNYLYGYTTDPYYSGGGSSGSGGSFVNTPMVFSPDLPVNIQIELSCFNTGDVGSTYTVAINVNQPKPNSRSLTNIDAAHKVGHTYISLVQTKSNGQIIARNVGFYASNGAKPGKETSPSTFADDSNTPYTVGLQISVSASEFRSVLNSLINQGAMTYDLQKYNCTSAGIAAFGAIPINLPESFGSTFLPIGYSGTFVAVFNGLNPSYLGEDLRAMNANDFNASHPNRAAVITKSDSNNKLPHSRSGTCP